MFIKYSSKVDKLDEEYWYTNNTKENLQTTRADNTITRLAFQLKPVDMHYHVNFGKAHI